MKIEVKHWNELSKEELYDILALRTEVFVVEQNCPYQECDGVDKNCYHVIQLEHGNLIGTARIIPKPNGEVALGRIVVKKSCRVNGWGKVLVLKCIEFAMQHLSPQIISMSAQTYLIQFYNSLGFKVVGKEYMEDDIPHIRMEMGVSP